jgi:hypothetical protein
MKEEKLVLLGLLLTPSTVGNLLKKALRRAES